MNFTSTVHITAPSEIPVGHGKSGTEKRKKNMLVEQAQVSCCSEEKTSYSLTLELTLDDYRKTALTLGHMLYLKDDLLRWKP